MPYSSAGYEKQEGGLASGINIYSSLLCTPVDLFPKPKHIDVGPKKNRLNKLCILSGHERRESDFIMWRGVATGAQAS